MTKITSSTPRRALALAALATAACAVSAPSAWADAPLTLCVHQSSPCPAGATDEGSDLQGALDAAAAHPASPDSPNVVDIEAGLYTAAANPGFRYQSTNPLRIIGAGSDSTTVAAADNVDNTLVLGNSPDHTVSVSGLTITNVSAEGRTLTLLGGTADHLVVSATQPDAVAVELRGAILSDSTVYAQNSYAGVEGSSAPVGSFELDDDTINGGTDAVQTSLPATIHRVTLTAENGVYASGTAVSIDDSVIEAQQGLTSLGYGVPASITAQNDTLVGIQGATQGVRASGYGGVASDVQITDSIIYAFPASFATYDDGPSDHATIEAGTNNYDGASSASGITRGAPIGDDPGFVAPLQGNYHLGAWSGLIDAAAQGTLGSGSSSTDRDGNPRVVTVSRAATPVDLGAYEYQPPASTGTPGGGNPGSGPGGNPGTGGNPGGANPGTGSPGTGTPSNGSRHTTPSHPAAIVKLTAIGRPEVSAHRRISLRLSCRGTAACAPVKVTATSMRRHRRVTVGALSTRLSAGHTATVSLALNRTGRRLLARAGKLAVTLTITVRSGARTVTAGTALVTLTAEA